MSTSAQLNVGIDKLNEPSIFRNTSFLFLWLTIFASSLSVAFFMFAINWYIVDLLKLDAMLGVVLVASTVPRLLFMLIGGVIADRMSKAKVMFISDVTKGILLIGIVSLLLFDVLSIWSLVVLGFLFGVLDAFFWPASNSILPSIVNKSMITRANSVIDMTRQISMICGPMLAGVLIGLGGYVGLFTVTSFLLLAAGVVDLLIDKKKVKTAEEENRTTETNLKKTSVWQSIKEGIQYVKTSPFLLALMTSLVFLNLFFSGPYNLGMPLYARNVLHGDEWTYSLLIGGSAAGMLVGSIFLGVINIRKKRGIVAITSIFLLALLFVCLSMSKVFWLSFIIIALMGVTVAGANIPIVSVIQSITPSEYLGRTTSLLMFSSMGLIPVSQLLTSLLLALQISIDMVMLISASILSVYCIFVLIAVKGLRTVD